ncbi:hypothetical protein NC656_01080 [Pseudomonas asiatica]|uniref:hypothetical protein n=1 Tax=Pseudomonas asiatica TaxID=2219225 RepID=UPI00209BBB83|nr:hypothetical protein [Pseudomonas asiatica]MCO8260143.1 hypothetical protein [Pseudomonas asiatica]
MTLISGYKLKDGGFLQADILLTSPNKGIRSSQIPSFKPEAGNLGLSTHAVAGLCQKILVVNEHFAVAFAGDVPAIQGIVRLIEKLEDEHELLTGKCFTDAVLADEAISSSEVQIIALSVEGGEIHIASVYADYGDGNEHFELWVGGSGADHAIAHYQSYPVRMFDVCEEEIVVQGTCMALDQFAMHLKNEFEEKFKSESISKLFGGGYEVVAFYDGRFRKISDIVYAFADAKFNTKGVLEIDCPRCLIKSEYAGADLKIRSVELEFDEEIDEWVSVNDRTFTIAPISRYHETKVEESACDLSFMGVFLCFLISIKSEGADVTIPVIRRYKSKTHFLYEAFTATVHPDFVSVTYSDRFHDDIAINVLGLSREKKQFSFSND